MKFFFCSVVGRFLLRAPVLGGGVLYCRSISCFFLLLRNPWVSIVTHPYLYGFSGNISLLFLVAKILFFIKLPTDINQQPFFLPYSPISTPPLFFFFIFKKYENEDDSPMFMNLLHLFLKLKKQNNQI